VFSDVKTLNNRKLGKQKAGFISYEFFGSNIIVLGWDLIHDENVGLIKSKKSLIS
jgi:hypothetical protein